MKPIVIVIIVTIFLASAVGVFFILNYQKTIDYTLEEEIPEEKIPETPAEVPAEALEQASVPAPESEPDIVCPACLEVIEKAEELIAQAQKFIEKEKEKRALVAEALQKSGQIKGIYVGAANNPIYFKNLLDETELNGVVVDVKEAYGPNLPLSLKKLIEELHKKDVWVIARVVVFRDSSLVQEKPGWYLRLATSTATTSDILWQDAAGQYWLDPANEEVQNYIIEFSKKVIDFGFDELQFDYIRYPDDYPGEPGPGERYKVIGDFFLKLSQTPKEYKPSIILSVDLFGYIATQFQSFDIGQRLEDAAKSFDYLSFMLYPSHFYGGFYTEEVQYSYPEVVEHPYEVVYHSILLAGYQAKTRPWLQDFNLAVDSARGVVYDAERIRAQIQAAEDAQASGWLLWNSSNVYTKEALE